jgi:hypothetical protein
MDGIVVRRGLAAIGTGVFNPALGHVALSGVSERGNGLAAGVNDAVRQTGIAVGVEVLGVIVPARAALGVGSLPSSSTACTRRCCQRCRGERRCSGVGGTVSTSAGTTLERGDPGPPSPRSTPAEPSRGLGQSFSVLPKSSTTDDRRLVPKFGFESGEPFRTQRAPD